MRMEMLLCCWGGNKHDKWQYVVVLRLCDVYSTEEGYSVHICGVYLVCQWSGENTTRWSLRECIYCVAILLLGVD